MTLLSRLAPRHHWLAILGTALVFLMLSASVHTKVYAEEGTPSEGNLQTTDENGNKKGCDQVEEAQGGVMLGRIVPCLTYTVETSAQRFSAAMIDFMMPVFWAFLTLVVIIFGLKVLQNEGQLQAQGLLLLIKIAIVLGVLQMIPTTLIPLSYGIMSQTQEVVMEALDSSSISCDLSKYKGPNTPQVWAQMDCLMGQLYGFATGSPDAEGNARPNMMLASSVLGLLGGFFFGGSFGVALFLICVGVLAGMFMMIMRVVLAYLNCYLIIAVYMILAPIYVPLIFLRVTEGYFRKWLDAIIAAFLLPLMICAYTIIAMLMYDKVMFADDSLMKKLFDNEYIKQAQDASAPACTVPIANDPKNREQWTGKIAAELYKNPMFKSLQPMFSGSNNACAGLKKVQLNLRNLPDSEFANKKAAFTALFLDAVKMLFMIWLIDAGFKNMMSVLRPMIGSGTVVNSISATGKMEERLQVAARDAGNAFRGRGSRVWQDDKGNEATGAEFIKRVPIAMGDAGSAFFKGLTGKE